MEDRQTYANVQLVKPDSRFPSRTEPDVSYAKPNIKGLSVPRTDVDRLTSTYSKLNIGRDEPLIDEDEDPSIASRPGELRVTAQTGAHEQEPKENIGNRLHRKIYLLCLVTSILVVIVAGLSIHVSQIRQSMITSDRNYHELTSHLNLSQRTCLKNLSALNSDLSILKRVHTDLRHQFTETETMFRSVNETKAHICELLTSRREQAFSQDWIRNEDRCYFISTIERSYDEAKQHCWNSDSNLLEINSTEEENFVNKAVHDQRSSFWIGKCKAGKVASHVVYQMSVGKFVCSECKWYSHLYPCSRDHHRFICETSAALCPDISEKIQELCQQPVGPK
ncbi:uncharacterized protein [Mobula birostris]|uniref:uncharacterized protein isoform X2 n=1 Tax=Mobula birostris TaxID=1983395 RepID=UPI003B2811A8